MQHATTMVAMGGCHTKHRGCWESSGGVFFRWGGRGLLKSTKFCNGPFSRASYLLSMFFSKKSYISAYVFCSYRSLPAFLVGGFNPSEKYESNGKSSPNRGENKKCLKPPPRFWKIFFCTPLFQDLLNCSCSSEGKGCFPKKPGIVSLGISTSPMFHQHHRFRVQWLTETPKNSTKLGVSELTRPFKRSHGDCWEYPPFSIGNTYIDSIRNIPIFNIAMEYLT